MHIQQEGRPSILLLGGICRTDVIQLSPSLTSISFPLLRALLTPRENGACRQIAGVLNNNKKGKHERVAPLDPPSSSTSSKAVKKEKEEETFI